MARQRVPRTDYARIAEYYDKVRPTPTDTWLSRIIESGKIGANCVVLDIGCGTGRFPISMLTLTDALICGLEPSAEMLRQAVMKDQPRHLLWVRGDGQRLPFRDGSFHCVYMTLVIHHIENREAALQETYRTLAGGGYCVIMTNSHARIKKHILRHFPRIAAIDLRRFPSLPSLMGTMAKIGFKRVQHHAVEQDVQRIPTDEYLGRVKDKYISTLTLLSEAEFQRGFKVFRRRIQKLHGEQIVSARGFDFIVGQK